MTRGETPYLSPEREKAAAAVALNRDARALPPGDATPQPRRDDDSRAIRLLFNGFSVLDSRLEVDILADGVGDLLPGLYRCQAAGRSTLVTRDTVAGPVRN